MRSRKAMVLAAVLSLSVLLAACGSTKAAETAATSSDTAAAESAASDTGVGPSAIAAGTNAESDTPATASSDTTVTVTGGQIEGSVENGVYQYLGVPYAEATELFTPASEVTPWEGVREATSYGPISYQSGMFGSGAGSSSDNESNNCQNLNLWTPGLDDAKRPVMVWLHGGGFSTGSANQDDYNGADLAADENVVVVGVNHRLGVYGFLNLTQYGEKYQDSANVGLLDIIDALQGIQDNIETFGGDSSNVTLFGQSGGGAKVLALMSSPRASGLFERGIVESGATETMGVVFTPEEQSEAIADETLNTLGISADDIEDIQNVSNDDLMSASTDAEYTIAQRYQIPQAFGQGYAYEWEPVIDGDVLPEDPVQENGFADAASPYGLLIGSNLNEWNIWMASALRHNVTNEITQAYEAAYPNEDPSGAADVDTILRLPILKITAHKADQSAQDGAGRVYSYVFTKQSGGLFSSGVGHGAEIPYVFGHESGSFGREMEDLWASFARDGVPSADGVETWEPYTRDGGAVMILDDDTCLAHHHDEELLHLLAPDYVW